MAGLVPAIHVFCPIKTWMPGTRPGMTKLGMCLVSRISVIYAFAK
jgi:hypothetical protein